MEGRQQDGVSSFPSHFSWASSVLALLEQMWDAEIQITKEMGGFKDRIQLTTGIALEMYGKQRRR